MSDPFADRPLPRATLLGAGALVAFTLVAVAAARLGGTEATAVPSVPSLESRDLRFLDQADGAVAVYDLKDGSAVALLPAGSNNFIRGALRGLARERKRQDIGMAPPFRLTRWADGRYTLEDTATRRTIDLRAFGSTNVQAFADLLQAGKGMP
ncbi:putative photosynthetic complex assembly protein [Dongia mobilis]|uniref:Putative photosynthetic complex assembly protein n=1 Tax=Dongia mobilis TaxID=578943 RepID=A0A4R6WT63_9PROT|nr:photosynthetic complex assembly protein PuhC [Dongia mobilis]TDQ82959.1 putative photosynthetic complex assembly protein [Dongia mobilis]